MRCYFRAFGLAVESDFALPGGAGAPIGNYGPRVCLRLATPDEIRERWSGACGPPDWQTVLGDGTFLQHESGRGDDQLFLYGSDTFLITSDAGTVLCSVQDPDDARWQRQLLDTILFSVSFASGFELLHASAVAVGDDIVAFVAPSGHGKSGIAVELGSRGYGIFCDDVLAVGPCETGLLCHPGPAVMSVPMSVGVEARLDSNMITAFSADDEVWVELNRATPSPGALRAVYVLDRDAHSCFVSRLEAPTVLDLLPHAISLPHDADRARSRFELFSELARRTRMFHLAADPTASTGAIGDLVEASREDFANLVVTA